MGFTDELGFFNDKYCTLPSRILLLYCLNKFFGYGKKITSLLAIVKRDKLLKAFRFYARLFCFYTPFLQGFNLKLLLKTREQRGVENLSKRV